MKFDAKVQKVFESGSTKAIVYVTIDDSIAIHGLKLIQTEKGSFVAMPSEKWQNTKGETKHADIVHPINAETRKELFCAVTEAYEKHIQGLKEDDLPFNMK